MGGNDEVCPAQTATALLGGLLVAATEEQRITLVKGATKEAVATPVRRRSKAPKAAGCRGPWQNGMKISMKDIPDTNI